MNTQKIRRCRLPLCLMLSMLLSLPVLCTAALAEGAASQPQSALSPTTGLPTDRPYRPFLVIVSNAAEARPSWNLSEADIVYEMIIWGPGHTRYAAVYNDNAPKKVGAIRSARAYHAYLRQEWDCPLVHAGGMGQDTQAKDVFEVYRVPKSFQFNLNVTGPYSHGTGRDALRVSPHNRVVNLSWMLENAWPADLENETAPHDPRPPLLQFSLAPTQGIQAATEVEIYFEGTAQQNPNYFPRYTYNPIDKAYERWYCGYKQYDAESGRRIIAHNVIIQFCPTSYTNNLASQPVIDLVGEGRIDAYIDGSRIEGTWRRESADDKTQFYDAEGEALLLRPGKTFIQVIPTTYGFAYDAATTLCRYAPDL